MTRGAATKSKRAFTSDEELDAVAIESSHTIDIDCFVPKSEIDERYVDSP
jgi:DNA end-binding protein Ku